MLTHLRNRNGYIESLNAWKKTKLERVGCIYIDLNGLKKTNDEQGHEAAALFVREFYSGFFIKLVSSTG